MTNIFSKELTQLHSYNQI